MFNIHQISKKTNRKRRENARYVRLLQVKKGRTPNGLGFIAAQSYSTHIIDEHGRPVRQETPHKYVTMILFVDDKLNVKVSCSCADFLYRWEWALWNRGAADIEYSNGDSPEINNPQYKISSCKHLFKLYEHIKSQIPTVS